MIPTLIIALNLLLLVAGQDSASFGDYSYDISPIRPPTPGTVTVQGFRQCGGEGKMLDWRNTACSGYHQLPGKGATALCSLPTGIIFDHEIDFRAGRSTSQLTMKFFVFDHGNFTQVTDQVIDNSAVLAGHDYTMHRRWTVPSSFSGQILTFKGVLSMEGDKGREFCGLVHYYIL